MQTFLPYGKLDSTEHLDRQRLGKQRVETMQILKALNGESKNGGWVNHPATRMWRGYEPALATYGVLTCLNWIGRGYNDTCLEKIAAYFDVFGPFAGELPPWFGDPAFHLAHRSNLIRKNPDFYRPLWPDVPDDLPYVWPA